MPDDRSRPAGSTILLDEYFAAGNDAFLSELHAITDPRKLAPIVERWKNDPRPWARQAIFSYLEHPLATPGHNLVVKRLFKHAEKQRDTPLLAAFLLAFDCLVRRQRKMQYRWNSATRQSYQEEVLKTPKNNLRPPKSVQGINPFTKQPATFFAGPPRRPGILFSYRTRYYLRRRVWRYFRFLGYRTPADYPAAIAPALARYTDEDLARGEHILDSWCLLNICFRKHPALTFTPSHVRLNDGRSLNELSPAPKHAKAWSQPPAAEILWQLLATANARLVRLWAIQLLQAHHQDFLAAISPEKLLPLFDTFDADTQQFATQLLEKLQGLPTLPVATWLKLLDTKDPSALAAICALMVRHVAAERLELSQIINLAVSLPTPVANLGLTFLRTRAIASAADRSAISELSKARCAAAAPAITTYALSILGAKAAYDVTLVSRFFDSLSPPIRAAAWAWLTPDSPGYNDPALWARLTETPYEDIRLNLVKILEQRSQIPGTSLDQLAPIWTSVLLGIHRGGRHKIKALHQISRALAENPAAAPRLLPIIAVAIRSVRPAEARVGLAAVVQAIEHDPALAAAALATFPELHLVSAGATA